MDSQNPIDDATIDDTIIERYLGGDRTAEVERAVRQLARTNPAAAARLAVIAESDVFGKHGLWNTEAEWAALSARMAESPAHTPIAQPTLLNRGASARHATLGRATPWRSRSWKTVAALAAAACILVVATVSVRHMGTDVVPTQLLVTTRGEQRTVQLPDSSVITLGPASTLRYTMRRDARRVELVGLASFRVTHDATRPFVVQAGSAQATDLGTEFVVRAYPGDSTVEVAVSSGRVELTVIGSATRGMELAAGDVGTLAANHALTRRHEVDVTRLFAWTTGQLTFENQPLSAVVAELGRWFDVEFMLTDSLLSRRRVDAVYTSPSLTGVLNALAASLDIRYERSGRLITISPKQP